MTSDLLSGENLIISAHRHWVVVVKSIVAPVILLVVVAIADFTILLNNYSTFPPHFRTELSLAALAIAILWLIVVWIRWRATSYPLPAQRIKTESGVSGRQSKIIPIDRIQDCS